MTGTTIPVEKIIATAREHADWSQKKIAKHVGTSEGSVQRTLSGNIPGPRQVLKAQAKPFRRIRYAGSTGGGEWNERRPER